MIHAFGYVSSVLLLLTLGAQIRRQWTSQSVEGVSPLLYLGQLLASAGFIVHSAVIGSVLFVVTNAAGVLTASVGLVIFLVLRRRAARDASPAA